MFFFEKKNQKTFGPLGCGADIAAPQEGRKFFCFFFFKKRSSYFLIFLFELLIIQFANARDDLLTLSSAPQPSPGFRFLSYANPHAPKGGAFTIATVGDFNNLNPFILSGSAPDSLFRVWQPLFKPSDTDSVTAYADLALGACISPDGLTITFHLNPRAQFSDGTRVTASDVVWTYHILISQGAPIYAALYAGVASATAPDEETAVFRLRPGAGRALILNLAEMYILPAHFWQNRPFAAPLRDFPIGSGAYQVSQVSYGNFITYARVKNWWASANPAERGFDNFDRFTEVFFHSDAAALQSFKARQTDARIENSAAVWSAAYRVARPLENQLGLLEAPLSLPAGIRGLVMNTRRPLFGDQRVRHALALAFDFAWTNRVMFHGAETRQATYFANSPMASSGLPAPAELQLLRPSAAQMPAAIFTTAPALPVSDGSGDDLPNLRQAFELLTQAGWRLKNGHLHNNEGQAFSFEILLADPKQQEVLIAYVANLRALGIAAQIRAIDPSAYQRRLENYDFDMTYQSIPATDYPDTEQAAYWGCAAAHAVGGDNLAGICTPTIDAMIAAEIAAPNLAVKTAAIHALDRLLLNGWYFIPWGVQAHINLAYWRDKVGFPSEPLQIGVDFDLWWAK